jgi:hypothetical protein
MKITYAQLAQIIDAADAVQVDGNLMFPSVENDAIEFTWDTEDGTFAYCYPKPEEGDDQTAGELRLNGTIKLTLYDHEDGEAYGPCIITTMAKVMAQKLLE